MKVTPRETAQRENNLGFVAASEESFTCDPELIYDQASNVDLFSIYYEFGKRQNFLVFYRRCLVIAPERFECNSNGMCEGVEAVFYRCDEDGTVSNWNRRYEVQAPDAQRAQNRLRFQLANDLATLSHSEPAQDLADYGASAYPHELGL